MHLHFFAGALVLVFALAPLAGMLLVPIEEILPARVRARSARRS